MKELKQVIRQAVSRWIERRKAKGDNETMEKTEVSTPETNGTACCPALTVSTDKQTENRQTEKQYLQYVLELLRIFFLEFQNPMQIRRYGYTLNSPANFSTGLFSPCLHISHLEIQEIYKYGTYY